MRICLMLALFAAPALAGEPKRPNILWITCEDMGPHLGCYGDKYANTPNLDKLAKRSLRYKNAWSNAPVCAPARSTIISGMYPTSLGAEHMRSMVPMPKGTEMYPSLLRRLGYYCTNWIKEDYNLAKMGKVWDDSSKSAHFKNRAKGQPFFAIFNFTVTHESQIRTRPHKQIHDPAKVPIPPYHPDTPEVRKDWAQYYDNIAKMDEMVGKLLQELEDAGLAEETIVFFFSDHGSGMPRNKRSPYNSGLNVPMMVHFPQSLQGLAPKEYREGMSTDRLVSFVDLAPTLLSLAGEKAATYHQGRAFLGKHEAPPNEYLHGFRGRMDERYDLIRSVRDKRYVYVRNFMPHKIGGQHCEYMFQTPTTKVWKKLFDEGKLNEVQSAFWKPRPKEEFYDLKTDPHETKNLAEAPELQELKYKLRNALIEHLIETRDVGFLPEDELHARSGGASPYDMALDEKKYNVDEVLGAAMNLWRAGRESLPDALTSSDSAVRYWGFLNVRKYGKESAEKWTKQLRGALNDSAPSVRIIAAETLGIFGNDVDARSAIDVLLPLASLEKHGYAVTFQALNALDAIGPRAKYGLPQIQLAAKGEKRVEPRVAGMAQRLVDKIVADWK